MAPRRRRFGGSSISESGNTSNETGATPTMIPALPPSPSPAPPPWRERVSHDRKRDESGAASATQAVVASVSGAALMETR
uniref:Uncharacterized protein n=1 Tax=Oryza rufipogon TaxID=4529 RepID=A0A0E0PH48_ORYRU